MQGTDGRWRPDASCEPDGDVQYRYGEIQQLIGILPATCRIGKHQLHNVGYTPEKVDRRDLPPLLLVYCNECGPAEVPWVLVRTKAQDPMRSELDDDRYRHLRPFVREPVLDEGGQDVDTDVYVE